MRKKMSVEEYIVAILVILMVTMVFAQVLSRYFLHKSLSHTEELVRYLFVWATLLGAAAATGKRAHLSIGLSGSNFPSKVQTLMRIATGTGSVVFLIITFVWGVKVVVLQYVTGQTTAALGMQMWIFALTVPVCVALTVVRILYHTNSGIKTDSES